MTETLDTPLYVIGELVEFHRMNGTWAKARILIARKNSVGRYTYNLNIITSDLARPTETPARRNIPPHRLRKAKL